MLLSEGCIRKRILGKNLIASPSKCVVNLTWFKIVNQRAPGSVTVTKNKVKGDREKYLKLISDLQACMGRGTFTQVQHTHTHHICFIIEIIKKKLNVIEHNYNPSIREAEAGRV